MSFQIGNLPFPGSARQPADHSERSTAQRLARGLPTGWGNDHEYHSGDHSAEQSGQHSHRSSAEPPAGELPMTRGVSLKWTTCPSKWKDFSRICATHLHAAPFMQSLATTRTTLREIPWRRILEHLLTMAATRMHIPLDAPKLLSAVVEAAGMSTLEDLAWYLRDWRAGMSLVWHALQLELTWCSRKKFKSSSAVIAATEAEESFFSRSDAHPAHETQAATWEDALTALEAGHVHAASGMEYEAHFTRGLPLKSCSKPPDFELNESDVEDAKLPTSNTSISRSKQAASQAATPSASSFHSDHIQRIKQ